MKRLLLALVFVLPVFHPAAHAAVIYSGLQNIAIPATFDGVYINIDNAATSSSTITGWDINPFFGGAGIANSSAFQPARTGTGNSDPIVNLNGGDIVGSTLNFSSGFGGSGDPVSHLGTGPGQFAPGHEGYIGFRFYTDSSSGPYYGWMRVILTANSSGGLIEDWSYDDSGSAITIPITAAPEPSRALFLMLGCLAAGFRRRR